MLHRVHFCKENLTVHVGDGLNLRKACLENDVDPYPLLGGLVSCHGKGFCGTCAVGVDDAEALSPPSKREAKWIKKHTAKDSNIRLSCQAEVAGDVIITTDPDTKPAWQSHTFYSGRPARSWEKAS
ncbi:MAG: 2Fe-2S iron-sulfur cluster-binding protein [Planctomycetota bacterium]|jgi:ferredoxin